jgi:hypothetical protein
VGGGNQSLNENVFLSHQEICISKWGKYKFFFVLTRNFSEWGKLVSKEKFVCVK